MKKKKYKIFKIVLYSFVLMYLVIYFSAVNGYYEYSNHRKVALTEEQIKKFENDINEGKPIDINEYVIKNEYTYKTRFSMFMIRVSDGISDLVSNGVKYTFKWLTNVMNE